MKRKALTYITQFNFLHLIIAVVFLVPLDIIAQGSAPEVDWRRQDWGMVDWVGNPRSQENSGDEWWNAHTKLYESDGMGGKRHIGYIAAGYSSWKDAVVTLQSQNNCFEFPPSNPSSYDDKCADFEIYDPTTPFANNSIKGRFWQIMARYDLYGNMIWCKRYNENQFFKVIQDEDFNILAIGTTISVKRLDGTIIPYNPSTTNPTGTTISCNNPNDYSSKINVVKVNLDGDYIWTNIYSFPDANTTNWKLNAAGGTSITRYGSGYKFVGGYEGDALMIQINKQGEIDGTNAKQLYNTSMVGETANFEEFVAHDIVASGINGNLIVTGKAVYGNSSVLNNAANRYKFQAFVMHFAPNSSLANHYLFNPSTAGNPTGESAVAIYGTFLENSNLFAVPIFYNGAIGGFNGTANCQIHFFAEDFDQQAQPSPPAPYNCAGQYKAFDLKMGITETENGFATVSTRQLGGWQMTYPNDIINLLQARFGTPITCTGYYNPNHSDPNAIDANGYVKQGIRYWDTDATIEDYDLTLSGNFFTVARNWEKTFDADDEPRQPFPGDMKRQECLYTITADDENGALTVFGNSSANFDDSYSAKLLPDRCIKLGLAYNVENNTTGTNEITSNTIWDLSSFSNQDPNNDIYVKGEVVIKSGWTLSITGQGVTVFMSPDFANGKKGRFFIEKGARLVIDGATITSDIARCPDAEFDGITIDGDNSSNQARVSVQNPLIPNQGLLEMSNGATLDNAKYAIRFGSGTWNDFGGVVQANDATIRATRRAVEFMHYPQQNSSYFNRCTFEYAGDFTDGKLPLVTLWANDGVKFYGCTFTDNTNRDIYSEYGNSGIFSMDAVYQVLPACPTGFQNCPTKTVRSSFNNLNQGVYALNDIAATNMVSIESADFNQNAIGFRVKATDGTRFIKNNVTNGGLVKSGYIDPNISRIQYLGYLSENAKDFTIEQNTFEKQAQSGVSEPTVGVNVKEAGRVANEVYNNSFKGQDIGQKFDGTNRNGNFEGLSFRCNTNPINNLAADVNVTATSGIFGGPDGIKTIQQGALVNESAGNQFSGATYRILNNSSSNIQYKHTGGSENPSPFLGPVSATTMNVTGNTCNTRFLIRNNLGYLQLPNNYVAEYYTKRANYDNLLYTLYQNIDNGNTDSLKDEINLYFPNEAQQMRNDLMAEAPYLSQEALMDAANTGVLTDALLLEICLANPEGTYGEEFLNFLEFEIPNPLPSNFITLIYQNWDTETSRTIIENQLSVLNDDLGLMGKNILNYYVEDTLDWTDSIENIIASKKNLSSKYDLVELAASQNNYTLANSRLTAIGTNYDLNDAQWEEHNNLVAYIAFRENKFNAGINMMQLQANDLTELRAIADALPGRTAALARSVLCFGYQECESNFPEEPLGRKKKSYAQRTYDFENELSLEANGLRAEPRSELAVYPNPTKGMVTIKIKDYNEEVTYQIQLRNLEGKLILSKSMSGSTVDLATEGLAKGSYLVQLQMNDEPTAETILVKQ